MIRKKATKKNFIFFNMIAHIMRMVVRVFCKSEMRPSWLEGTSTGHLVPFRLDITELHFNEQFDLFFLPICSYVLRTPFSWARQHATVYLKFEQYRIYVYTLWKVLTLKIFYSFKDFYWHIKSVGGFLKPSKCYDLFICYWEKEIYKSLYYSFED